MTELHPQSVNAAVNKHKQEGELVVPVVAPALLVRVRHGPGLRTLETCNMQTLGGRKTFSNLEDMKTDSSKTFQPVYFGKYYLSLLFGPRLYFSL